jgi:hypothetical protein
MFDKVVQLFDEEMDTRMKTILTAYATMVSKKHGISLELLLRDIPPKYETAMCKGHKVDGEKCGFRAVENGYCRTHVVQFERIRERIIIPRTLHTHGSERMYVRGCPACDASKNELIDMTSILRNE